MNRFPKAAPLTESKTCECGCGTVIPSLTKGGKPQRFVNGHYQRRSWLEEDRGHISPCWIWQGSTTMGGYARAQRDGRLVPLHRWHYEQKYGPVPRRLQMDHLCRQPSCVNPDHVEPVTGVENVRRSRVAKLTEVQAAEIRHLAAVELATRQAAGFKRRSPGWLYEMAARYDVVPNTIKLVIAGATWR